jgi:hypothetical protein
MYAHVHLVYGCMSTLSTVSNVKSQVSILHSPLTLNSASPISNQCQPPHSPLLICYYLSLSNFMLRSSSSLVRPAQALVNYSSGNPVVGYYVGSISATTLAPSSDATPLDPTAGTTESPVGYYVGSISATTLAPSSAGTTESPGKSIGFYLRCSYARTDGGNTVSGRDFVGLYHGCQLG